MAKAYHPHRIHASSHPHHVRFTQKALLAANEAGRILARGQTIGLIDAFFSAASNCQMGHFREGLIQQTTNAILAPIRASLNPRALKADQALVRDLLTTTSVADVGTSLIQKDAYGGFSEPCRISHLQDVAKQAFRPSVRTVLTRHAAINGLQTDVPSAALVRPLHKALGLY